MREMKDSGIEWIGEIPNDWDISKIKFVADFEPTCNLENISPEDRIAYAPMECIKQGFYEARDALYEELSHSLTPFQNGDIVMAKVTPCFENGNIAIMNELPSGIGLGSSELFVFRAKNIVAKYLFYWLQNSDFIQRACSTMTGVGGLKRVSPFFCKNCEIHIPLYNEQCRITAYLDRKCSQIDAIIARQQEVIEKLKAYKLSVITEAVTKGLNPDVPMKDSGVEWIGEIPEHWVLIKATRIIISTQNGLTRRDLDKSTGQIVLKLRNISSAGEIDYEYQNRIELTKQELDTYRLKEGDFLFVRVNGSKSLVGKCAIFHSIGEDVAYNDHIIRVRISEKCMEKFFFWYLLSICGKTEIDLHTSTSAGQYTISGEGLRDIRLVLPPKTEQLEIDAHLSKICNSIDKIILQKQTSIDKLTAYKKSLIYEVVTGKKEV